MISILYLDGKYYVSSGMYSSSHVTEYDEETDELILMMELEFRQPFFPKMI